MSTYPMNQFAPQFLQGVPVAPSKDTLVEPRPFEYLYEPPNGVLTASQDLQDTLQIQTDADFLWCAWYVTQATGAFEIQITDSNGYQIQSGLLNSTAISVNGADPTVQSPAHRFPAGSAIQIHIRDLSAAENTIQISFKGIKEFRITKAA